MRVVGCLGDASKQNIERFDVVMVKSAAVATSHLFTTVRVVGRTSFPFAGGFAAAPADKPRVATQRRGEHVVEVDVADDE